MASVAGCATGVSKPSCPPLVAYTADQQAAVEVELNGNLPVTARFIADYGHLRAECRAMVN